MGMQFVPITLPDPPRLSRTELLDVLPELPDSAFDVAGGATRWMGSGLDWVTRDCDGINVTTTHCTEGNPFQVGLEMAAEAHQGVSQSECLADSRLAFMLWAAMSGSTLDAENEVVGDLTLRRMGDFVSYTMADELITGAIGGSGLADDATPIVGGPVTIANGAVGHMEEWFATRAGNTQGFLHVSKTTLAALYAATAVTYEGGRYYTPSGHIVVADGGYQEPMMAPNDGAPSTAGNGWAYITGPVWYRTTVPEILGPGWTQLDRTHNILEAISTAYAIFVYKACSVGSMLITY